MESVQITHPREIEAVKAGEIEGDCYSDGQVFAEVKSLAVWRAYFDAEGSAPAAA